MIILEKLGLAIEYEHRHYDGSERTGKDFTKEILEAKISTRISSPSQTFITTPKLRSTLSEYKYPVGKEFGRIKFTYHKKSRLLEYSLYFPLPIDPVSIGLGRNREVADPKFTKKGIASMIETKVLDHAIKLFPRATKVSIYKPQIAMRRRIRALGINYKEQIKLKEFRTTLRGKVAKDIRTARAKRPLALRH